MAVDVATSIIYIGAAFLFAFVGVTHRDENVWDKWTRKFFVYFSVLFVVIACNNAASLAGNFGGGAAVVASTFFMITYSFLVMIELLKDVFNTMAVMAKDTEESKTGILGKKLRTLD